MQNTPKVSVIIPVYNVEKYLRQCLDSVVNQTLKDIEIICVNDGSIDESPEILKEYKEKDKRVVIINQSNKGLSAARNAGLKVAKASYIGFVDSDDWIDKTTYENAVNIISADDEIDLVCWGANVFSESGTINCQSSQNYHNIKVLGKQLLTDNVCLNTTVTVWNKLYKREIIQKEHLFFEDSLLFEDNPFFWNYVCNCKYGYYMDKYLYNYLKRDNSITGVSTKKKSTKLYDRLIGFERIYGYYENKNLVSIKKDLLNTIFKRAYVNELENSAYPQKVIKKASQIEKKYKEIKKITPSKLENILSIKNSGDKKHKIISILGVKLKLKNKHSPVVKLISDDTFFEEIIYGITAQNSSKSFSKKYNSFPNEEIVKTINELKEFYFYPNVGNLGDVIIAESEYQMLNNLQINYTILNAYSSINQLPQKFNLVYGGGGLFVKYWNYQKAKDIFLNPHLEKAVILPSSFWECDDLLEILDERFTVFCREEKSYKYCCSKNKKAHFILANDMAFSISFVKKNNQCYQVQPNNIFNIKSLYTGSFQSYSRVRKHIVEALIHNTQILNTGLRLGYCLRSDVEKLFETTELKSIDLSHFATSPCTDKGVVRILSDLFIRAINTFDIVVTDRLHIGIISALLGKQVVLLDNTYGKLSEVYKYSMSHMDNVKLLKNMSLLQEELSKYGNVKPTSDLTLLNEKVYFYDYLKEYISTEKVCKGNTIWESK